MSAPYFIVQTSKFVLINDRAVTLCEGHWKVIQYIYKAYVSSSPIYTV